MAHQPGHRGTDPDALISVAQAAALLGVHPNTVRIWTEAGRLPAYRINARGDRRFRRSDVERLLVGALAEDTAPASPAAELPPDGELAVLGKLARGAASARSVGAVARIAIEALRIDLGIDRAAVYLAGGGDLELETHAGYRVAPPARLPLSSLTAPGGGSAVSDGQARLELSLTAPGGPLGLLVLECAPGGALTALRTRYFATLAAGLACALHNAHLLERARREVRRARALRAVTQELTGQLELSAVLDDVVERTRSLFEADKAGLWLLQPGDLPFELAAHRGLGEDFLAEVRRLRLDSDTVGVRAIRDRRSYALRNADSGQGTGLMRGVYAREGIRTVCLIPLIGPDEALGLIGLYHAKDRAWPDDELALAQAFANQAAVAIQNARLYRSLADQAARMRSIQDLSARLNRLTDVQAIGEAIVAEARTLADYHDIRVYAVDWESRICEPIAFTREMLGDDQEDAVGRLRVEIGEGFTGWAAEHGEPLLINDALEDERGKTIDGTEDVPESMLVVPMLFEGRALGVIVLSQLGFHRFSADDLQTMSIFAGYAAQAIANASAYEQLTSQSAELERRVDLQRRLLEINERLLSSLDHASVLETVADGLRDVVRYDNLSIYRTDHQRGAMIPVLTRERHAEQVSRYLIPFGRGLMGWAVTHNEPILANDALADPRALQIPGTPADPEAVVVVPLVADGEVLGALNVSRVGGPEVHFSISDFELVQLFAAQASIALRNADTHHAVSQQAETDALTGLGNHGAFQRDLAEVLKGAEASTEQAEQRVALLMMDLDRFKAYNDRHGHPAGDALLHAAGTAIYGATRSDDRVYRYGGDEFVLILPGASVAEAARAGQRIRHAVRRLTTGNATPVTITVGVAGYPGDVAADRAELVAAADTALYFGKQAGEDRVVRADQVPRDIRDLRGALDQLAREALRQADDEHAVEHIVERAALLATHDDRAESVREALLAVARSVDSRSTKGRGHADRVGRLAARIAGELGIAADSIGALELAARLHALDERGLEELQPVKSLRGVAELIRGYRRLLIDGERRSRRGSRSRGAVGPHVIAVANGYDELTAGVGTRRVGRSGALARLHAHPATFRQDVLEALAAVVAHRTDAGRRRRQSDAPDQARGVA
ncbi:MAG: GAF domain-containing protein [Candidatus Limnocylindria bacterium]